MSKQMTPMKRLQNNIDNLRSHIFPFFKEVTLNKADSHYNPHGGEHGWGGSSKGVESDFIAIYKSISVPISFAFTYTYMGKDETEQRVEVSIKNGDSNDDIIASVPYTLDQFKEKINKLNKDLKNGLITDVFVLEKVSEHFLDNALTLTQDLHKANEEMEVFVSKQKQELNLDLLEKQANEAKKKLNKAEKALSEELSQTPEQLRINELHKELESLIKKQEKNRKTLTETHKIKDLSDSEYKSRRQLEEKQKTFNKAIESQLANYPKTIAKKIKMR